MYQSNKGAIQEGKSVIKTGKAELKEKEYRA